MALQFITIKRSGKSAEWGTSSLALSDKRPGVLEVIGELPHCCYIEPDSIWDARQWVKYLTEWIDNAKEGE